MWAPLLVILRQAIYRLTVHETSDLIQMPTLRLILNMTITIFFLKCAVGVSIRLDSTRGMLGFLASVVIAYKACQASSRRSDLAIP